MFTRAHKAVFEAGQISGDDLLQVLDQVPSPLAFVTTDTDFQVLYVNRAFTRLFGYTRDDVKTAAAWTEIAYPEGAAGTQRFQSWQAAVTQAMRDGTSIPYREGRARCKDGSYRCAE